MESSDPSPFAALIGQIADQFEAAWKAGERPALRKFLESAPEGARPELLEELVRLEVEYRRRVGEDPLESETLQQYQDDSSLMPEERGAILAPPTSEQPLPMGARLRIFISSPGDVAEERVIANKLVRRLSDEYENRLRIEPVFWEHEPLLASDTFQSQIPRPSECEIVICILWSRLGTRLPSNIARPDGTHYASGTEYEFEDAVEGRAKNGYPDLLVYRKTARRTASLDEDRETLIRRLDQKEALDAFVKKWFFHAGDGTLKAAFHTFETTAGFEQVLEHHLRRLIERRLPVGEPDQPIGPRKLSWTAGSPFRGLDVFEFQHAPIFFGRTRAIGDVLAALRSNAAAGRGFALVVGISGGGKSSLVRAGVLPVLTQPGVIDGVGLWRRAVLKPSDSDVDLLRALAGALLAPEALPELGSDGTTADQLATLLRQAPAGAFALIKGGLSEAAAEVVRNDNFAVRPEARLVVVVDQLEELFTREAYSPEQRRSFVAAIASLARSGKVFVIATLRGDFYHRIFELPELVALQETNGQYALPLPTPAELTQLICQPARAAGLSFEVNPTTRLSLDEVLREAAAASPESLPLLEFTLEELFHRRSATGLLSYEAYVELGGVEGALTKRAELVYDSIGTSTAVQASFPRVMRALVTVGSEGAIARQQSAFDVVAPTPEARTLVDAFVKARLFSADRTEQGTAVVRVTHEALLRNWPLVTRWLEQDRELLIIRSRVDLAATRWQTEGRRADLLLSPGKPLLEAQTLVARLGPELSTAVRVYVAASETREKRRTLLRRAGVAALACLTLIAGLSWLYATSQRSVAEASARLADAKSSEAQANAERAAKGEAAAIQSAALARASDVVARRRLAARYVVDGWTLDGEGDSSGALLWFAEAARVAPDDPADQRALQARVSLYRRFGAEWSLLSPPVGPLSITTTSVFSRDGRKVLARGSDQAFQVLDVFTGDPVSPPIKQDGTTTSVVFSPDGTRVAIGSGNIIRVWDVATGQPVSEPMTHAWYVDHAEFSSDGKRLLTVSNLSFVINTARVWDAQTGKAISPPVSEKDYYINSATFSPDGKRVVSASHTLRGGHDVRIWDAETGQRTCPPMELRDDVRRAVFSPDGKWVVTAGGQQFAAMVWDATTGKPVGEPMMHPFTVDYATFCPDGAQILTLCDNYGKSREARIWDAATGEAVSASMKHAGHVWSAAFSPGEEFVVTACADRTARVWDATTGDPVSPPLEHNEEVRSAIFSPDGNWVLTASEDKTARVWGRPSARPADLVLKHEGYVTSAAFSADGTRVVTAGSDKTACLWDAATAKAVAPPMQHQESLTSATFSPDGKRVLTSSRDGTARVWDAATGQPISLPLNHGPQVLSAAFNHDATQVVTVGGESPLVIGGNRTARVWDAATGHGISPEIKTEGAINDATFSPDGANVITASTDGTARIWDAATGKPVSPPLKHADHLNSVNYRSDGARVVTSSEDHTARVWNVAKEPSLALTLVHPARVTGAQFSPDGTRVLTVCGDGTTRVWDAADGQPITPPMRHDDGVSDATFSLDGTLVATAGGDTARIWDAATGLPISPPLRHEDAVFSANFSRDGRRMVTASRDGSARIWDVSTNPMPVKDLVALAEFSSGLRVDATGSRVTLSDAELRERFDRLRREYPEAFRSRTAAGDDKDEFR